MQFLLSQGNFFLLFSKKKKKRKDKKKKKRKKQKIYIYGYDIQAGAMSR